MHATSFELMHEHVRAIHKALTGSDLPDDQSSVEAAATLSAEAVAQHFADLDALVRGLPEMAERVPPFSFAPPLDVSAGERELVIEVGVPGVERAEVDVEVTTNTLTVTGARLVDPGGRLYYHAEIPRGPFRRSLPLPQGVVGTPRIEVEHGIVRIRLEKAQKSAPAKA